MYEYIEYMYLYFLFKRSYLENILVVVCNYVCKCLATLYVTCFWEMYFVFACSVFDVKIVPCLVLVGPTDFCSSLGAKT